MNSWVLWACVLLAQNASFTMVSRARNSKSLGYHAFASVLSNGMWFLGLSMAVDKIAEARVSGRPWLFAGAMVFYTCMTVIGSVSMHHFLMTKVEKGNRKIG